MHSVGGDVPVYYGEHGGKHHKNEWKLLVFQPQEPYVTNKMDMGSPTMYHAPPPAPYVIDYMHMESPSTYQAPPPPPYITHNMDIGTSTMYQAPSPAPYVTDGMDMGPPMMLRPHGSKRIHLA